MENVEKSVSLCVAFEPEIQTRPFNILLFSQCIRIVQKHVTYFRPLVRQEKKIAD